MSELKVIRSIVTYTLHRIENIEKTCMRQTSEEKEISLLPKLPLMELVQLETFEEKLCNEKENQQLVNTYYSYYLNFFQLMFVNF